MDSDRDDEARGVFRVGLYARSLVTTRADRLRLGERGPEGITHVELAAAVLEIKGMWPELAESLLAHAEALFGQEESL